MARDRSHRALILAFCAVVICFLASTAYTQWRVRQLDNAASTIANVAAPRIETLASLRAETHDLAQQLTDYVGRASEGLPVNRERVRESQAKLQRALERYNALPHDASRFDHRGEIEHKLASLNSATESILTAVDQGDRVAARAILAWDVRPAVEGTRTALIEGIQRHAENTQRLAVSIASIRSSSTLVAYVLNGLSILLGAIAVALAIGAARRYTELLESQRRLLANRAKELELFAGRVAHDVLGPLSSVSTFLGILDRHLPAEENKLRDGLRRAHSGLSRSSKVVRDLLDFAKAGAPPDGTTTSVDEVLDSLSHELQPLAREAGVDLRIEPPREPCLVFCRPGVLMSLIDNLASNAIKYTADSPVRVVGVRSQLKQGRFRVEVADSGPGLAPQTRAVIFEPFVRAQSAKGKPGIGLGLATVKRLVAAHGGEVGVESEPGRGCTFWFELPGAPVAPREKADLAETLSPLH